MMTKADILLKVVGKIETGNMREAARNLAEDFALTGPAPEPLSRSRFLNLMAGLVAAMPDWRFNVRDISEAEDTVRMKLHITGTNTASIDVPELGLQSVPATGKGVNLPDEPAEIVFRGNRIVAFNVTAVPGGGVQGVFDQLGVALPELVHA